MLPAKQLKAPLLIALKLKKTKSDRLWNRSRRNRSKFHNRRELVTEEVVKKIFNDAEKSKPKSNSFPNSASIEIPFRNGSIVIGRRRRTERWANLELI